MTPQLPVAPPRVWLLDQRAAIARRVAEARRLAARAAEREQLLFKALAVRAAQLDTTRSTGLGR